MVRARPQPGSTRAGAVAGSPTPALEGLYELWLRRGEGRWRSEGTGSKDGLRLKGVKEVQGLEERGFAGEIYIGRVGDFPDSTTKGNWPSEKEDGDAG